MLTGCERFAAGGTDVRIRRREFYINPFAIPVASEKRLGRNGEPFVSLVVRLDRQAVGEMIVIMSGVESPAVSAATDDAETRLVAAAPAAAGDAETRPVGELTPPTLQPMLKLAGLLATPDDASVLGPLTQKELIFRLLRSDQAQRLRLLLRETHRESPVVRAANWLRDNASTGISMDRLAALVAISPSAL